MVIFHIIILYWPCKSYFTSITDKANLRTNIILLTVVDIHCKINFSNIFLRTSFFWREQNAFCPVRSLISGSKLNTIRWWIHSKNVHRLCQQYDELSFTINERKRLLQICIKLVVSYRYCNYEMCIVKMIAFLNRTVSNNLP